MMLMGSFYRLGMNALRKTVLGFGWCAAVFWIRTLGTTAVAQVAGETAREAIREPLPQALSETESRRMVVSVDRGIAWLLTQQQPDGSFWSPQRVGAQPALTALGVMAALSRGHCPGEGPVGKALERAIDFTLECQKTNGLLSYRKFEPDQVDVVFGSQTPDWEPRIADSYNHGIALLMLGEVYGQVRGERGERVRRAIEKGLLFTHYLHHIRKKDPKDEGGWRYIQLWQDKMDSDLSVTGWHALSLRSAKNAGFDVPGALMEAIGQYALRCYDAPMRSFRYGHSHRLKTPSVAMTGAGILCLALAGTPSVKEALDGAAMIAEQDFRNPATFQSHHRNWPYYTCYYASQAAAQLGGTLWKTIYQKTTTYLLQEQDPNGAWPPKGAAGSFGPVYSTTMAILALTPQLQLLPIYQH
ncbi:MAG: hypothetical protein RLZZ142_2532 [Verrucomicrobiota bacterium]